MSEAPNYTPEGAIGEKEAGETTEETTEKSEVDSSLCQFENVVGDYKAGLRVECESFSPYLADHNTAAGKLLEETMPEGDLIGIEIAKMLKEKFPDARMISLYDEYNSNIPDSSGPSGKPAEAGKQLTFPEETKRNFRNSVKKYLEKQGIIREGDIEGKNYLLVSESSKTEMAQELIDRLKTKDVIEEKENGEILFNNGQESFTLRTKSGRWMCEALDASSFLDPHNLETTHLVILPEHFRQQQDRVWLILTTLGFQKTRYHNIFFDEKGDPKDIADQIRGEIERAKNKASK